MTVSIVEEQGLVRRIQANLWKADAVSRLFCLVVERRRKSFFVTKKLTRRRWASLF